MNSPWIVEGSIWQYLKGGKMSDQPTCKERIKGHLESRLVDIRKLWKLYQEDSEASDPDLGDISEYGLWFDYSPPEGRKRGFFRWQISTGGPGDEFRFYAEGSGYKWHVNQIQYVFLDWWDVAKRSLSGAQFNLLNDIFQEMFVDTEGAQQAYQNAMGESDA